MHQTDPCVILTFPGHKDSLQRLVQSMEQPDISFDGSKHHIRGITKTRPTVASLGGRIEGMLSLAGKAIPDPEKLDC